MFKNSAMETNDGGLMRERAHPTTLIVASSLPSGVSESVRWMRNNNPTNESQSKDEY